MKDPVGVLFNLLVKDRKIDNDNRSHMKLKCILQEEKPWFC